MRYQKTHLFDKNSYLNFKNKTFGTNWPVVYILSNDKRVYIGESTNVSQRLYQHFQNEEKKIFKNVTVIAHDDYNKSATLDIESKLIEFFAGDGGRKLTNRNGGMRKHDYYERPKYEARFEQIWADLIKNGFVTQTLDHIKNKDLFKFSPYKSLTEDQLFVASDIESSVIKRDSSTSIVHGGPGTGKTILAIYLYKHLKEDESTKHLKVGFVIPMMDLRKSIKKVFTTIEGLRAGDVMGPSEVLKDEYDVLIVDEAHRLKRRQNLGAEIGSFDNNNNKLGLGQEGTQLDWILHASKHQILFYDERQSIKPTDVRSNDIKLLCTKEYQLETQHRVNGGPDFIEALADFCDDNKVNTKFKLKNYTFKLYDSIHEFYSDIKEYDQEFRNARMIAGYSWPWDGRHTGTPDVHIEDMSFVWNRTPSDSGIVFSVDEIGCIHTIQGFDLSYAGVIFGREIDYDFEKKKIVINREYYFDQNGRHGTTEEELDLYIRNIYKTLMTRGAHGLLVYIVNDNLKRHFKEVFVDLLIK